MKLKFITSISKNYWNSTGKYCINSWNLPGDVTIYIDQKEGDLDWIKDVPFHKELLHVPAISVSNVGDRTKVRKFWGKACAQIDAVRNRSVNERIIWLDADVEQINPIDESAFNFEFDQFVAMMNSNDNEDCWESGLVIFNQQHTKLNLYMSRYEKIWNDEEHLSSLWRPYDAQVLGNLAETNGYMNLCLNPCSNVDALKNTKFNDYFVHWINKTNKKILTEKKSEQN
jgi:hypothetical protein